MYLDHGNIHTAKLGVRMGKEAFFQLLQMPVEGSYIFKPALFLDELMKLEPIVESGDDLWHEAMALKMELVEYREIFPDMLAPIQTLSKQLKWDDKTTLELANTIWYLLEQPKMNLAELLARTPCCNSKTYRILTLLDATGQINIESS
jgi:hypothetical protein